MINRRILLSKPSCPIFVKVTFMLMLPWLSTTFGSLSTRSRVSMRDAGGRHLVSSSLYTLLTKSNKARALIPRHTSETNDDETLRKDEGNNHLLAIPTLIKSIKILEGNDLKCSLSLQLNGHQYQIIKSFVWPFDEHFVAATPHPRPPALYWSWLSALSSCDVASALVALDLKNSAWGRWTWSLPLEACHLICNELHNIHF